MNYTTNKRYLVLLLYFIFISCNSIPGVYIANYSIGVDTLKIFNNNKYVRICYPNAPNDSIHYNDSGTWTVLNNTVYFRNWFIRNKIESDANGKDIIYGTEIRRNLISRDVKLIIDDDKNYYYHKVR